MSSAGCRVVLATHGDERRHSHLPFMFPTLACHRARGLGLLFSAELTQLRQRTVRVDPNSEV